MCEIWKQHEKATFNNIMKLANSNSYLAVDITYIFSKKNATVKKITLYIH